MRTIRDLATLEAPIKKDKCLVCRTTVALLPITWNNGHAGYVCALCAGVLFTKGILTVGFNPTSRKPWSLIEVKDWGRLMNARKPV